MRSICSALLAFTLLGQQNPPAPDSGVVKFTSSTQLVVEMVTVTAKDGKPIEGLSAKDFTVTEDGKPQAVSFCEFQRLEENPSPVPAVPAIPSNQATTAQPQIAPEKPGDVRYRNRRLLILYFDQSYTPLYNQLRAFDSAIRFVRRQMTAPDLVAILAYSHGMVRVRQDFTDDRAALVETLKELSATASGSALQMADENIADLGSAFGQDYGEFNIFNTDRQLAGLQTAARMLGNLNEKKSLIYFASGLKLRGMDNQAQLRATVNAAVRANVSLFTVDARGLMAEAPLGDATVGSAGGAGMYTGALANAQAASLAQSQDTLWSLAADTGGKALLDNNDLSVGIVNAQRSITSYYILGYYTSNEALDGRFRKIKVTVDPELNARLEYRRGYWSGKRFADFSAADKERQLEEALMLGDPITDLTIALEINHFQLNRAEYYVPVAVKIPGHELVLARKRGAEHTVIDFIGEVKDEFGVTMTNVRDKVDIKLSGQTATELASRHIQYDTGFTLLPGTYTLKFLARDAETGRIGTYLTNFVIPNLNKETERIPISSVVLSGQYVELKDALYTAGKLSSQTANPLVSNGRKLIPSVTRVFSTSRDMYVYLQAYQLGASPAQPLFTFVSFYRGQSKAFETSPLAVTEAMENRLKTAPMRLKLSLEKLRPGRYTCQVTVIDPTNRKAAFWQAPIMFLP
ncbi:MAG: VWA domain-containing protein [Acidobacteriales bacterium]|nr:VWA domain-containing protein [Terriglobales bacterium]